MLRALIFGLVAGWTSLQAADLKALEAKAEAGDFAAQYQLAELHHTALETQQDFAKTLKWAQSASNGGHAMAQYRLASMYLLGEGVERDVAKSQALFKQALPGLQKLAEEKNADASNKLGVLYARGVLVEKDPERAVELFRVGTDAGLAKAFDNMGSAYLMGAGVERDPTEAGKWLEKAAEAGMGSAQLQLGIMNLRAQGRRQDIPGGMKWIRKASECNQAAYARRATMLLEKLELFPPQAGPDMDALIKKAGSGDVDAQLNMAKRYQTGDGVRQDKPEAVSWLTEAAYQANTQACLVLGGMMTNHPDADRKKSASAYWRLGAWLGQVNCQANYAIMCAKGDGVRKDFEQAYHWMLVAGRSANNPQIQATFSRLQDEITKELDADLILEGLGRARDFAKVSPKNEAERRRIARAFFGDGESQLQLGKALADLFPVRALIWLQLAEQQEVDGAAKAAKELAAKLNADQTAKAAQWAKDFSLLKRLRD